MKPILVTNDPGASAELIWTVLESRDYTVIETQDGQEGLENGCDNSANVIFLDFNSSRQRSRVSDEWWEGL